MFPRPVRVFLSHSRPPSAHREQKQKSQKIDGKEINDGSELKNLKQDNIAVAITAVYHTPAIKMYLKDINFKGDVIKIFEFKG